MQHMNDQELHNFGQSSKNPATRVSAQKFRGKQSQTVVLFWSSFFGHIRAKITICLAYLNGFCSIGWEQSIPKPLFEISRRRLNYKSSDGNFPRIEEIGSEDESKKQDDLRLCWSRDMNITYITYVMIL